MIIRRDARRPYLILSAVIDQSPDQLLAVFERATDDSLCVSSKEKCFPSVWCDLNKAMIRWGFQSLFAIRGAAVNDWTCKFARVPETSRYVKLDLTHARLSDLPALLSRPAADLNMLDGCPQSECSIPQ
jgi:hypothetical protein